MAKNQKSPKRIRKFYLSLNRPAQIIAQSSPDKVLIPLFTGTSKGYQPVQNQGQVIQSEQQPQSDTAPKQKSKCHVLLNRLVRISSKVN
jgi:hypothetical protein